MFEICDKKFKNKSECLKFVKNMLEHTKNNAFVSDLDRDFLLSLLKKHPDYKNKVKDGLIGIKKLKIPPYPTFGFVLIYNDGKHIDFSYKKCLYENSQREDVLKALRQLIYPDINIFLNLYLGEICPITKEIITFSNHHVHHKEPKTFEKIVDDWLEKNSLSYQEIKISKDSNSAFYHIEDKIIADDFRSYHLLNCELILLSKKGHKLLHKESYYND